MSSINTSFSEEINFIHLSDTHLPDREDYVAWDVSPMQTARITIDQMTELTGVDFCVHTGDVCDVDGIGNRASYRLADQLFGAVKMPKYFVAGNHDSPEIMHDYLDFGQREHVLEHKNKTCYQFNKNGLAFFVLDARQGRQSVGYVDREQQDWLLERFLALSSDQKVVVFMHYPLFNQTVPWIQQKMLVKNAGEVHSVFKKFSNQLLAVFHGHIHSGLQHVEDNILYVSAPSGSYPFDVASHQEDVWIDHNGFVGFNVVTISKKDWSINIKTKIAKKLNSA